MVEIAMYREYYGLTDQPFDLSSNPRFLFLSAGHREALVHLQYGLTGRAGLTVLVGEAGTGKTTLVKAALATSKTGRRTVHLANPTLSRSEFFAYLSDGFDFAQEAGASKRRFLRELEGALTGSQDHGGLSLIVDEAQSLPNELLEEVRLLTNTEATSGASLGVILVGQPELATRLNDPGLRQLKQRIALRCELAPLDLRETAAYIAVRVRMAGGKAEALFTREAVTTIFERSKGIPRTISVICDNALVSGFALARKPVGRDIILEVCRDFQLGGAPPRAGAILEEASQVQPIVGGAGRAVVAGGDVKAAEREGLARMFPRLSWRRRVSFF